jgi:hypothetical protein
MQALITDLLTYSQVSKLPDNFTTLNLKDLVQDVLADLEASVQNACANIRCGELPSVFGDALQLRQLFQNLLSNALKFTDPSRSCEIEISSVQLPASEVPTTAHLPFRSYHAIQVKDNGIGFEQQYAQKVFRIFQRLHSRDEYEGTGIGLAIVQKVVENHRGFITADGQPGKGATFTIYLPA